MDGDLERSDERRVEAATVPDRTDLAPRPRRPAWQRWWWLSLLPLLALVACFATDRALHRGAVLRGVEAADVPLGGLDAAALEGALAELSVRLADAPLAVRLRDRTIELDPRTIGLALDVEASAKRALRAGRQGSGLTQLGWWGVHLGRSYALEPVVTVNETALEAAIAGWEAQLPDRPTEGAVTAANGDLAAEPPRRGFGIDRAAARERLLTAFALTARAPLDLPLVEVEPLRRLADVEAALERAQALCAGPVTLSADLPVDPDAPPASASYSFSAAVLAGALRSQPSGEHDFELSFDPKAIEPALAEARAALERPAVDARFVVDEKDAVRIVPSRRATFLEPARVAAALLTAASSRSREAPMPVEPGEPPVLTTDDAGALGIRGLVSQFTTRYGCCPPRVTNIHRIAELVDAVIVRPGETFSINAHVGPRTVAKGFVAAPTIVHGEMEDTIGGGVSQFATTFFNAAFYGGYEIVERQPHSFWFQRYPMGHEATLSFPKPDVIIKNDTAAGLYIHCVATSNTITVKLYGDNGGRQVRKKVSAPYDLEKPPVEFIADRSIDPEDKKVKERGSSGWSITVSRILTMPDGSEKVERRKVTYQPRPRRVRVHPCRIPRGDKAFTGEPCPKPVEEEDEDADSTAAAPEVPSEGVAGDAEEGS
jgi:vancomycin resistance protein YoaR